MEGGEPTVSGQDQTGQSAECSLQRDKVSGLGGDSDMVISVFQEDDPGSSVAHALLGAGRSIGER